MTRKTCSIVSFSTLIRADQIDALKALSECTKVPVAVIVRDGIDAVLRENEVVLQAHRERNKRGG